MAGSLIDAALAYAAKGWSIVPIPKGKKYPDIPWDEFKTRRATPDELRAWFADPVITGMAVVLGPVSGGLAARDYDIGARYDEWAENYNAQSFATVKTRKGAHVYFRIDPESKYFNHSEAYIGYEDGELRMSRCICLLPPSAHPDGGNYSWLYDVQSLQEIDPEEYGLVGTPKKKPLKKKENGEAELIIEPGRNSALTSIAGALRRKGLQEDEIAAALHKINTKRVRPPLPGEEVDAIAHSVCRYEAADPITQGDWVRPVIVCMADVVREKVEWLWYPYIPKGKLTFLDGDPKVGKSMLALQISAIISRGFGFPDVSRSGDGKPVRGGAVGNVLYLNAEDGLGDTIGPRLDWAGADSKHFFTLTGVRVCSNQKITDRTVTLQDVAALEIAINEFTPELIVIDPIQAYMGPKVDMNKASDTRPVLAALAALAEKYRVAVLVLRHLTKGKQTKVLYQGMGSIDFAAAARSILRAERDKDDHDKRILVHIACNLAKEGQSISYELADDGFKWGGLVSIGVDDIDQEDVSERDSQAVGVAVEYLEAALRMGPELVKAVEKEARRRRISEWALKKAKAKLDIKTSKIEGFYQWSLPA